MPQYMQVEVMDPEEAARKLEAQQAELVVKEQTRLAAKNRAAGLDKPEPGDRLYVTSARGIPQRSRAGCLFKDSERTEVLVVEDGGAVGPTPAGFSITAASAEMILDDNALTVTSKGATDFDASELRKQLASRDAEIDRLKADHARALREARMGAKDPGDGSPGRLMAARKVKGNDPDFGGDK